MKRYICYYAKNIAFLILCISLFLVKNNTEVYGCVDDGVVTTDIWATTYDETAHWEYCTLCGEIRNKKEHTFTDTWAAGYESCYKTNYCRRVCDCGYNYTYTKPHGNISELTFFEGRFIHYNKCYDCGQLFDSVRCHNENGLISCKNPGVCLECGGKSTSDHHRIMEEGICEDCGVQFIKLENLKAEYMDDRAKVKLSFDLIPVDPSVTFSGDMNLYCPYSNFGYTNNVVWESVKHEDGSITFSTVLTFVHESQRKAVIYFIDDVDIVYVNGTSNYVSADMGMIEIWQDDEKPVLEEIKQVDQVSSNSWATIKELTITGTDKYTNYVTITIKDKETGEVIINKAKADVIDKNFAYKCTPAIEAPVEGKEFIIEISDEIGNTITDTFMVYKTDSKAPRLVSSNSYTEWSQTKNLALELEDYGSGNVSTSINDQNSYKNTKNVDDKYIAEYVFDEDNYGTTVYTMFMKDGLGNATKTSVTVGKIDNTKPTITDLKTSLEGSEVVATVTANDKNKKLGAEGSGVYRYGVTSTYVEPTTDQWQTSNEIRVNNAGTYYIWVKDLVGNIGDVRKLMITDGVVTTDKIIYDSANGKENIKETDADEDKTELYDETPKTGDYRNVKSYVIYMIISCIGMTIIMSGAVIRKFNLDK